MARIGDENSTRILGRQCCAHLSKMGGYCCNRRAIKRGKAAAQRQREMWVVRDIYRVNR